MSPICDQSVIEYARSHGIVIDHTTIDPLQDLDALQISSANDSHLPQLALSEFRPKPERLRVTKDAAKFLSQACTPPERSGPEAFLTARERVKELKLELPLLRTDHEADMRNYRQAVRNNPEEYFPSPQDAERKLREMSTSVGFEEDIRSQMKSRISAGKPRFSKAALLYLQNSIACPLREKLRESAGKFEGGSKVRQETIVLDA